MKNLIVVFALLLCASVMFGQNVQSRGEWRDVAATHARTGTSYASWTYTAETDTMQPVQVDNWSATYYVIQVKDSAAFVVSYMPSWDGVTFMAAVTIDSLSNANNAGNTISIALPSKALGCKSVKFVRQVESFRLGTSSATANEKIHQIK